MLHREEEQTRTFWHLPNTLQHKYYPMMTIYEEYTRMYLPLSEGGVPCKTTFSLAWPHTIPSLLHWLQLVQPPFPWSEASHSFNTWPVPCSQLGMWLCECVSSFRRGCKLTLAEYNARFSKLKGTCKKYTIVGLYSWKKNESSCNDKDVQSTWGQVSSTAKLPTM